MFRSLDRDRDRDRGQVKGKLVIFPLLLSVAVCFAFLRKLPPTASDMLEGCAVAADRMTEGRAVAEAVARELLAGTTVGRQALVGNVWYAPLPSLTTLLFAPFTEASASATAGWYASLLALIWCVTVFARRLMPHGFSSNQELDTSNLELGTSNVFPVVAGFIKPLIVVPLAAVLVYYFTNRLHFDPFLTIPAAAFITSLVKLFDWIRTRLLRDWVKFTFAFAALSLCGIRGFIPAAVLLAIALICLLVRRQTRERFFGLTFLFLSPFIYGLCVWSLMSFLILEDCAFPLRGIKKELFTTHCEQTDNEIGLLSSVFKYVDSQTPYGRVFICGYDGLAQTLALPAELREKTEPCIDLHIDLIRKAYVRQNIYFLVHKPVGPSVLDSSSWRYPALYDEGHGHLLYCADFGNWRLFELIAAQPAETENADCHSLPQILNLIRNPIRLSTTDHLNHRLPQIAADTQSHLFFHSNFPDNTDGQQITENKKISAAICEYLRF